VRRAAALAALLLAPIPARADDPIVAPTAPAAALVWSGGHGSLAIEAPTGWHVAPNAPTRIALRGMELRMPGDPRTVRVPLAPGPVEVEASFSLCEDA